MQVHAVTAQTSTLKLQHIRRTIEVEMLTAAARGVAMTQAHVGQLEILDAAGAELHRRDALIPPPAYVETNLENGQRLSFSIRVF